MTELLVVDNYDSFAYNLVQSVGEHADVVVRRNDDVDVEGVRSLDPDGIVVSPGPGTPADAGVSVPVFRDLDYPTLGVCLGHQALCAANGASVEHAPAVVHGKSSQVRHDGRGVFAGLPARIETGRYHSLAVPERELPVSLEPCAWTVDAGEGDAVDGDDEVDVALGEPGRGGNSEGGGAEESVVMAVRHRSRPHVGVQFHPESILTPTGDRLLRRFIDTCCTT